MTLNSGLDIILIGEEVGEGGISGERTWFFRKMTGPLEKQMGGRIDCDKVWLWCPLLGSSPVVRVNLPSLGNSWKGFTITDRFLRGLCLFRQVKDVRRKPLLALSAFQVPTAQNNMSKNHILE